MTYDVRAVDLTEQPTAVVRANLPIRDVGNWLSGVYAEVMAYLRAAGVAPDGPPFARYTMRGDTMDVEAGFPVATTVSADGRITPSSLPGGPAAVTRYYGPYDGIEVAYAAVSQWLKDHGHEPNGPHWEVYHTDPEAEPDPTRWRTDLVAPYQAG